ncbi:MAG TPA: Uma2 family endonuclease [Tepidisphaeraceae bacterium]|nr:Uma2 family endonuclease [Tepidisphaeraceae bacterium]
MSTLIAIPPASVRPHPLRWTGEAFDRADESGAFDGRRVELMNGEILEFPPMNDPHAQAIRLGDYALREIFPPDRVTISVQCPMRLGEARPMPDFVVVAGTLRQIVQHPTAALLVIKVSDSSLEYDRTEKAQLYAAHGIADYWIINLNGRCLEVHRNPVRAESGQWQYGELRVYSGAQTAAPLAAPQVELKVADLLP